jgi:acyl-coenzyme A synthetase/AMP-(fatty) acid ligase
LPSRINVEAVDKIFEFARQTPDAWAMVHDLEPVTYRTLHRMITAMRRKLATHGLRPGGVVVVWIYSARVSWVVNLALRTLGLTTVSIRSPAEFAGFGSLDIVAVVTSASEQYPALDPALAPGAVRIVVQQTDWDIADDGGALEPPPPGPVGDHILLTSGTTGNYKMMIVNADAQGADIKLGIERYRRGADDVEQDLPAAINILNLGLWTAAGYGIPLAIWSLGAAVIIHQGQDEHLSFATRGITHAMVTPAGMAQMLAAMPASFQRNDNLQLMVTGGQLSRGLANRIRAQLTNHIVSFLGATECGGWAMTTIESDEDLRWHRLDLRRTVEVVDENDQPLPPGRLGQVRVLLENDFTGYLNDPDATASFVKSRYFYPGDLGILDGKGRIALHGRVTEVLSVLGDKIPAAPYEQALQEALGLEGVCVLSEQGDDQEDQLHVVLETAEPIDEATLRKAALAHLSRFPSARFHFLDPFPRNHMGKVERFKLKQRLIEQQQAQASRQTK